MQDKFKRYLKEALVFIVILTIAMNIMSYYKALDLNKDKLEIESFRLIDNTEYTLPKDKPLLLHFWATWCPTCKLGAANIEKISKDYEVITIAVQSGTKKDIQNYLQNNNLSFKVVNDKDGFYSRKFNIKAFPSTLIYDKERNIKFSEVGYTSTVGLYVRMLLSK